MNNNGTTTLCCCIVAALLSGCNLESHQGAAPPPTSAEVDTVLAGVAARAYPHHNQTPNADAYMIVLKIFAGQLKYFEGRGNAEERISRLNILEKMSTWTERETIDHNALFPDRPWVDTGDLYYRVLRLRDAVEQARGNS